MKKVVSTFLISLSFLASNTAFAASSPDYYDVSLTHLYASSITLVSEKGIVNGYPDGSYKPDVYINRAELTKIVSEAFLNYSDLIDFSHKIPVFVSVDH